MRYIERTAVLLAACLLIGVLVISRQEVPLIEAEAFATPSACSGQDRLNLATAVTPAALLHPAELVTLPRLIQDQAGAATLTTIMHTGEATAAGGDFEHYVLTLPRQIQDQVRSRPAIAAAVC